MLKLGIDRLRLIKEEEYESQYKLITKPRNKNNLGFRLYKKIYNDLNQDHIDFSWKGDIITLYKYCPELQDEVFHHEYI